VVGGERGWRGISRLGEGWEREGRAEEEETPSQRVGAAACVCVYACMRACVCVCMRVCVYARTHSMIAKVIDESQ